MAPRTPRRTEALTREVIVDAATRILDAEGEGALTLRALTTRLSTGYGAIYHHVSDKGEVLAAASDEVIGRAVGRRAAGEEPREVLRAVALGLFDAIDAHPWVGAQLSREPWRPAMADVYETVGAQLAALGVPEHALGDAAGVLVTYILGVAGQNAAHARLRDHRTGRDAFLATVAAQWSQLDPERYPRLHRAALRRSRKWKPSYASRGCRRSRPPRRRRRRRPRQAGAR